MTNYNNFEIINHGVWFADQFPGCGTALTPYTNAVTGAGSTVEEAYEDAVEGFYASFKNAAVYDLPAFADSPIGLDTDAVDYDAVGNCDDCPWVYVTVRW